MEEYLVIYEDSLAQFPGNKTAKKKIGTTIEIKAWTWSGIINALFIARTSMRPTNSSDFCIEDNVDHVLSLFRAARSAILIKVYTESPSDYRSSLCISSATNH
jgi:hypothetical protein